MKNRRNQVGGLLLLVVAGLFLSGLLSNAQQTADTVPLDRAAIFKTHVPHENVNLWRSQSGSSTTSNGVGSSAKPGGGVGGNIFTGTGYSTPLGTPVAATTSVPAAEEHIAVDPTDFHNLVAAISDFSQRGGWNTTKYSVSYSNGDVAVSPWAQTFVPCVNTTLFGVTQCYPATADGQRWQANSDPVVAIDKMGNVYLANLYFNGNNNAGGFYVSVGTLGSPNLGISAATTYPVATQLDPNTSNFEDKEWIAVDYTRSASPASGPCGNVVYASWTHFFGSLDAIYFSKSTDCGQTWDAPVQVSNPAHNGAVQRLASGGGARRDHLRCLRGLLRGQPKGSLFHEARTRWDVVQHTCSDHTPVWGT
jgi:hypothetical protein